MAMAKCVNLAAFVDLLIQAGTEDTKQEWYFVGGKLYSSDSDHPPEVRHVAESRIILDRPFVMKRISASVKSNVDDLLKASTFRSHRYDAFSKNDVESISGYFSYFAGWSREVSEAASILGVEEKTPFSTTATTVCLILSDCPIFSTLSRFVASNYAAFKKLKIYVDKKYMVPALSFAFFLCQSGMSDDEISVFPSTHGTFPEDKTFHGCVNGVIPIEFPLTIVTDLLKNSTSNIYLKKHSACPVLVLKSADLDSVVTCLTKSTRDLETLWLPNVVYVEEPVYTKFLDTLKFAVNINNQSVLACLDSARQERLNAVLSEKNNEGYEVVTLHYLFHSCIFIENYEFTLLDSSKTDAKNGHHFISILPVRHETEGLNEMNKNGGLCASVWTNDVVQAISIPLNLNYGTIWINNIGLFDSSVPFSMWNSQGTGSLSGKRMLFENIEKSVPKGRVVDKSSYSNERNAALPKRTLSEILKQSSAVLTSWSKARMEGRLRVLQNIADTMDNNRDKQSKISVSQTADTVWKLCVDYLRFWSTFVTESAYEENFFVRNCLVSCRSEPVGVVAILAGTICLEQLFFYVAAALVYGNVVIVGMSTDQQNPVVAQEFEQLFGKGSVTVITGARSELWQQFTTASSISSVWFHADADSQLPLTRKVHHQTIYNLGIIFEHRGVAKTMETYATKAKCVWLPYLGGGVESTRTTY